MYIKCSKKHTNINLYKVSPSKYTKKLWGVLYKDQIILSLWMMMNHTNNNLFAWMMKRVLIIIMHSECNKEWKVGYIAIWSAGLSFWLEREKKMFCPLWPLWLTVHKSACKCSNVVSYHVGFVYHRGQTAFDGAHQLTPESPYLFLSYGDENLTSCQKSF